MNSILIWETFNTNLPIKQNLIGCWSFCSEVRSSVLELGYIRIFICFGEIICFDRPTGVWGSFSQANTVPSFANNVLIWNNRNSDKNKFQAADKILNKFFSILELNFSRKTVTNFRMSPPASTLKFLHKHLISSFFQTKPKTFSKKSF